MRSREGSATHSADERVARARRQANQPGGNVPREGGDKRAQHGCHGHDVGVDQTFADSGRDSATQKRTR